MLVHRCLIAFACIAFTIVSNAQDAPPPLLVITDLRTLGDDASVAEAQAFSDFIRREVERTGEYRIISRASMMSILKAKEFKYPCFELPCFVRMGRILGADRVLAGHLHRRPNFVELTLRTIDVNRGVILDTVFRNPDSLSQSELLGEWGLTLIADVLNIKRETFDIELDDEPPIEPEEPKIPEEVLNQYPGMVYVPSGETVIGSMNGDITEQPLHTVELPAFYIGRHEVTNLEYKEFVDATGHRDPYNWIDGQIPIGKEKHPVSWVSFEDAEAYCQWKGGRLPTEFEWERAAKGERLVEYPWGNEFDIEKANTWETGREDTAPVGSFPAGVTPFGAQDMAGNVFEWTSSFLTPYPDARYEVSGVKQTHRILRGGSWNFEKFYARCSNRLARPGGERSRSFGFRLARDAEEQY